jgi:hypothetical protein
MENKIIEKWIDALRSGNYQQGKTYLKDGQGGFCCLGVLCDSIGEKVGEKDTNTQHLYAFFATDLLTSVYPRCVQMNDSEGYSFSEIADFIEAEYLKLGKGH